MFTCEIFTQFTLIPIANGGEGYLGMWRRTGLRVRYLHRAHTNPGMPLLIKQASFLRESWRNPLASLKVQQTLTDCKSLSHRHGGE